MESIRRYWFSFAMFILLSSCNPVTPVVAPAPVRVGVVLDLTSDTGRRSLTCISKALDDFYLRHASYNKQVDLHVRNSQGDLATATRDAMDLIENFHVQAIIWGPRTSTEALLITYLGHSNRIPVLSFSSISPTSCIFSPQDPITTSRSHGKISFTDGNESIVFLNQKDDRRNAGKLNSIKSRSQCNCTDYNNGILRIAVPLKTGFHDFVHVINANKENPEVTGYSIDVFEAAMKKVQNPPNYEFCVFPGAYDDLVGIVSSEDYCVDAAVGDVTITADRLMLVDFTMPYTPSGVYMLVLSENNPTTIQWIFVKPLTWQLWSATVIFFSFTGFVVWVIERSKNGEFQGSSLKQFHTASYFAWSTLTFSHDHIIRSPLSKIVVVIWCFVVLVLVQSYTANLSSILTTTSLRPSLTDLEQLRRNGDYVGYQSDSFVGLLLINLGLNRSKLRMYGNKEEYVKALRMGSKHGGVAAIVDEIPYLTAIVNNRRYQNEFKMVDSIQKTPGFGFAFRQGSALVHNLSTAILNLTGGQEGTQIKETWFGKAPSSTGGGIIPDTKPLTLESFSGLFIITGSVSTVMLIISIASLVHAECAEVRKRKRSVESSNKCHDSPPLENSMADVSIPDEPPQEAVDDDFHHVHGSSKNDRDRERGLMQQNGMCNGRMPAGSIQIEMNNILARQMQD